MKVCNLYGQGFYYIPGTDTCIKIGGFLRTEIDVHAGGSFTPFVNGGNALQTRTEDNYVTRARGVLTADVREHTSYGTLRAYLAGGWQYSTDDAPTLSLPGTQSLASSASSTFPTGGNSNLYLLRAFIQWGGFTFGKTASFYDFFNTSKYTLQTNFLYQDFAGVGIFTYGYTQQLGNGIGATIALQDPSPFVKPIVDMGSSGNLATQEFFDTPAPSSPTSSARSGSIRPGAAPRSRPSCMTIGRPTILRVRMPLQVQVSALVTPATSGAMPFRRYRAEPALGERRLLGGAEPVLRRRELCLLQQLRRAAQRRGVEPGQPRQDRVRLGG